MIEQDIEMENFKCRQCGNIYADNEIYINDGLCPNCGANDWQDS